LAAASSLIVTPRDGDAHRGASRSLRRIVVRRAHQALPSSALRARLRIVRACWWLRTREQRDA